MHEGGHDGRRDDGLIRHIQKFNHQEGGCAQDRRRDLPACGRCGFDRACKLPAVAHPDHGRNGERAHRDRIGHRRAAEHAEHGRAEHTDLGRATGITPGHGGGDVQKQLAQTDARGQHAKQHKVKNIGRHHADCHAINALAGEVLVVDHLAPAGACVLEQTGKVRTGQRVSREAQRNQGQGPAHGAASGFEQGDEQDRAHDHIQRVRVTHAEGQVIKHIGDVHDADRTGQAQQPVNQRHAAPA